MRTSKVHERMEMTYQRWYLVENGCIFSGDYVDYIWDRETKKYPILSALTKFLIFFFKYEK